MISKGTSRIFDSMGNSVSALDSRYVRIWNNLTSLQSDQSRMQMLETLLVGQEFVNAAKRAGVYGDVLQWMAAQRRGEFAIWPGIRTVPMPSVQTFPVKMTRENALTTVAAPKRALDALHEAYAMLEIDDTKPLTQDSLKSAYRKVASKHHPDRGGSTQAFDKITRSFKYLEEVLNKLVPSNNGSSIPFTQSMHSVAAAPSLTVPRLHGAVTHPPAQVQLAVHQQQQQQQQQHGKQRLISETENGGSTSAATTTAASIGAGSKKPPETSGFTTMMSAAR